LGYVVPRREARRSCRLAVEPGDFLAVIRYRNVIAPG